jgi:hypothetical protein
MPSSPLPTGPPAVLIRALFDAGGSHAHCRGCRERVNVGTPMEQPGWHTVHACAPEHAIEVNVRSPGAEPWAWRYVADAAAASAAVLPTVKRRRGTLGG